MSRRCLSCMEEFDEQYEVCPHCGYIVGTPSDEAIHMEPGTILHGNYIVGKVLGFGGFGVTYIGWDMTLQRKVAIKEYLPSEFSTRMPGHSMVTVFEGLKQEQFRDGLEKFVDEARRLLKFQSEPGIVSVFDSFEDNDTAYIIMEYLDGQTLTEYMKENGPIPEDQAVEMIMPVLRSLETVNAEGLIHRDIAPDNIFITKTGEVKLIDFGASRYATASHSRSLTVIVKPGYSPEEQYRSNGDQGPHTDVYAMAATMYKMITGVTPPDSMERRAKLENSGKDILVEPHKLNKKITLGREVAIMNGMNPRVEDRTPDMRTFIEELNADPPAKRRAVTIKRMDFYHWPLWLKVTVPTLLTSVFVLIALLMTGVIDFSIFSNELKVPENVVTAPDVYEYPINEGIEIINDSYLLPVVDQTIESEYIPAGTIILQTPVYGVYVEKNSFMHLTVSSGGEVKAAVDGKVTVPYVIWSDREDAVAKLKAAGLSSISIKEEENENVAYNQVITQSLEAGTVVKEDAKITLSVSSGPSDFAMPDVTGKSKEDAFSMLVLKGLKADFEYEHDDNADGSIITKQSIEPGKSVIRGDSVLLTVLTEKDVFAVENVVGKEKKEARTILKGQGLDVTMLENYDNDVPEGHVISQSPEGGSKQIKNSEVTLYVSLGKQPVTISLDPTGGTIKETKLTVRYLDKYGSLGTPERTGYTFDGWYTAKDGGQKVTADTQVTNVNTHVLYAHWKPIAVTVSLNPNGGSVSSSSVKINYDSTYGNLPTPTRKGYTFTGWYNSSGQRVGSGTVMKTLSTHTLRAEWTINSYRLIYNANGGTAGSSAKTLTYGSAYGALPSASRTGYTFNGWFTAASGGSQVSASTTIQDHDTTIYAHWTPISVTVSLNANGGSVSPTSVKINYGSTYAGLPTPSRTGYTFNGWYNGGTRVDGSVTMTSTSPHTLTASWSVKKLRLTFNANGGSCSESYRTLDYNATYGTLPTASRSGYTFTGWFTSPSGGTKVSSSTRITSDTTIYAQYSGSDVTYTIHYLTSSGAQLAAPTTITIRVGQTVTVSAGKSFEGYTTPKAQSITGSATGSHDIYFYYVPVSNAGSSYDPAVSNLPAWTGYYTNAQKIGLGKVLKSDLQ